MKRMGMFSYVKIAIAVVLVLGVIFLDRIWAFLNENAQGVLEYGGASLSTKVLVLIFIALVFVVLELNEIKRNLKMNK